MTEYSLEETKNLARELAKNAKRGECYCLIGNLGAGKTEFARAFIQSICGEIKVLSPTFNIMQSYDQISHFDLYRLKTASELAELGFEEALQNSITLIEWPEIGADFLPAHRTEITLEILPNEKRRITICKL